MLLAMLPAPSDQENPETLFSENYDAPARSCCWRCCRRPAPRGPTLTLRPYTLTLHPGIMEHACAIMLLAMLPAPSSEGPSPAGRCGSECVEHVSEAGSAKEPPPSLEPSFDAWLHASFACSPAGQRISWVT